MKGIDITTGRRLSQIVSDGLTRENDVAVWLGPGHVQEFYAGIPNCMVIDSADAATKAHLVDEFSSNLIRFYYGEDLIGSEIGAAAKNVIGIAAGMLDGMGLSTLKGALMSRGTREIAALIKAMGGSELSAYGLCHLGDYETTLFSKHSHNRAYGEGYVKGEKFAKLAEGVSTTKAVLSLAKEKGIEMPITEALKTLSPVHRVEDMPHIPYHIINDLADELFPPEQMDAYVEALRGKGHTVTYHRLPNCRHGELTGEESYDELARLADMLEKHDYFL